ncbi:hypothetical protein [Persephonella sp.]
MKITSLVILILLIFCQNITVAGEEKEKIKGCVGLSLTCYYMGTISKHISCKDRLDSFSLDFLTKNKDYLENPKKRRFLTNLIRICRKICEAGKEITYVEALDMSERECKNLYKKLKHSE